jgi:hypothetical protein
MARKAEAAMAKAMKANPKSKIGPRSGFIKATFSLEPEQLAAVVGEAQRRAGAAGRIRADASEVVREALDAWIGKRK